MSQLDLFAEQPQRSEAPKPVRVAPFDWESRFDTGFDCFTPKNFPTLGCRPDQHDKVDELIQKRDWKGLQRMRVHWYCDECYQWHKFSSFFFEEFRGVYPHEWVQYWQDRGVA